MPRDFSRTLRVAEQVQRELADLQRTAEGLRAELRGMNVPGA